jgi:transposase
MNKKYIVRLTEEERKRLTDLVTTGKAAAYKIRHANMLLKADADGPAWKDETIAEAFSAHVNTVAGVRQRFVEQGLEAALNRKKRERPPREIKVTGEVEAKIIALRCSEPPEGYDRWTLRLLADKAVEMQIVDSISHEAVRQVVKKKRSNLTCSNSG